ncbi:DEAD/DEAH box helicase [Vibrio anguillarum]|uniref:DEAD/DEAH box helicase family protein n=1 Tax=Vibrio anguillarum TaxID=55601 RepID=UPI00188D0324|nr:DEAD/DEAH box helicase family protein [Vibrio anguillarum]MBF4257199.1 DEAD/DEAH box helicase [Vibrio anguillarum]MBF4277780.1 DEAD/DEAH box helicase [Vibrio anguillarum]MBF4298940.1 DEAD/DEAH box helicase [Vibrio anguillarum]MBF4361701.1 DEAD/DEAH box helicase [Vibrio anguillarum]MBF4399307.1 DEAD/DEAH box helicase [Vibrio anguillarum]
MSAHRNKGQATLYSGPKLSAGGKQDPLLPKLIQAINHASEIEISVSFVQPSGLDLLFDPILDALKSGASLKLLTSDYLAITHPVALRRLMILAERGAQCRIFTCESQHSFHMKSYIFVKTEQGTISEGCAWVGSNNISKTALLQSYEWALRHDFEQPATSPAAQEFEYIREQFSAIFSHEQSVTLSHHWIDDYLLRYKKLSMQRSLTLLDGADEAPEIPTPNSMQVLALSALNQSREQGYVRGLVVLATGMGKTWLAAFDAQQMQAKRVLFVAHREEILTQAESTFSKLIPNAKTGLYNGSEKTEDADYLFASVATLGKKAQLARFKADDFDYIIVDEFHHASARSYRDLLAYFQPAFLLGLTATPERSDQADILSLCDNNLVFERNLVHGIDEKILVPFHYYGIYDQFVDYQEIPWRNGKFDPTALDSAFATKQRAEHIYQHWFDKKQQRTLAFCISKRHADYMAKYFSKQGVRAIAVYSDSQIRRNDALKQLNEGSIDILFSVDLFNEGTDLPAIDTILMIRPTESKILFLQQLGRGLRQSPSTGKQQLLVLDFIGNHSSFLNRPATLLNVGSLKEIVKTINQTTSLAAGCYVNFEPQLLQFWQTLAKQIRSTAAEDYQDLKHQLAHRPSAAEFFHHGYDLSKVRRSMKSWFRFVADQESDLALTQRLTKYGDFLLKAVEITAMSKCFKAVLLEALLELDGLRKPPTLNELAIQSHKVLSRRPDLMRRDLTEQAKQFSATGSEWLNYWNRNPVKAFTSPDSSGHAWFKVDNHRFLPTFAVDNADLPQLHDLIQELVDLRFAEYIQRVSKQEAHSNSKPIQTSAKILPLPSQANEKGIYLPLYPDLKIACGHFKQGSHDTQEQYLVAAGYGKLDPTRHFIAPASGNSMNGGKNPIQDGDLLLLEWVTPKSAGSISNLVMAIETQDETGDNHYLLRVVRKMGPNHYQLEAQNADYAPMLATDSMRTFARLKAILR